MTLRYSQFALSVRYNSFHIPYCLSESLMQQSPWILQQHCSLLETALHLLTHNSTVILCFHISYLLCYIHFSPCLVTNPHPGWFISRSKPADRLEKMGRHLLQDSLMLVGTDDNSNLIFSHQRPKHSCFPGYSYLRVMLMMLPISCSLAQSFRGFSGSN